MQPTANSNAISCRAFERVSGMLTGDIEWFYFPNICRQNKNTSATCQQLKLLLHCFVIRNYLLEFKSIECLAKKYLFLSKLRLETRIMLLHTSEK